MFKTGLTSITFRKLSVSDVIGTAKEASLDGIEWGSDVHLPPGDTGLAEAIRRETEAAGLSCPSYGSYFRCDGESGDFLPYLETAVALGASVIRVWAGRNGSAEATSEYRREVVETLRNIVEIAAGKGVLIGLEYHGGTLTDTQSSAHQLLSEVGLSDLKLYWQPRNNSTVEDNLNELEAALPYLSHLHAFHWGPGGFKDRLPFADGKDDWLHYLRLAAQAPGERYIHFEFTRGDSPKSLLEDAAALHDLMGKIR